MAPAASWFITGGVRSGKSRFAEEVTLAIAAKEQRKPYYIASGVAFDEEMQTRIQHHREDRQKEQWTTLERPTALRYLVEQVPNDAVMLWDCVTTWLTNEMYTLVEGRPQWQQKERFQQSLANAQETLMILSARKIPLIIVSNELLDELPMYSEEVEFYKEQLGLFHQWLVQACETVVEMDYSIPFYWKRGEEK